MLGPCRGHVEGMVLSMTVVCNINDIGKRAPLMLLMVMLPYWKEVGSSPVKYSERLCLRMTMEIFRQNFSPYNFSIFHFPF